MSTGFYRKLARNNIRKNDLFYIPQIMTGIGLTACFYIVFTLSQDKSLGSAPGGYLLQFFMGVGSAVIALLSLVLILYTNSFLMRRRRHEYGLYNALGMEKRHVGKIMMHETIQSAAWSILCGLAAGILFYKLCSLLICKLFKIDVVHGFEYISLKTIIPSALFFIALYAFAYLVNRISLSRMNPVELLKSRNTGEKEPKVKWLIFLIGIAALGAGYILALYITSPIEALMYFFPAVLPVIIGTYFLFTSGSIFVLKVLKKNAGYYYNKKHMFSVSGLLYRMKQNAAGLASIAILSTGVLIMISSTVSLYSGMQDMLKTNYPRHLYLNSRYETSDGSVHTIPNSALSDMIRTAGHECGNEAVDISKHRYLEVTFLWEGNTLYGTKETDRKYSYGDLATFFFMTSDDYEEMTGARVELSGHDVAVSKIYYEIKSKRVPEGDLFFNGQSYHVTQTVDTFPVRAENGSVSAQYGIIVADESILMEIYESQQSAFGDYASEMTEYMTAVFTDREQLFEMGSQIGKSLFAQMESYAKHESGTDDVSLAVIMSSIWEARENVLGMYGTFLFLGIILCLVCLFATVLIIYYKQISEGYEDRCRYQIMKKVGMSDSEIRDSIRTQTRLIFFLPPITAMIHTAFAFPMINHLLRILMLSQTKLFIICTLITCAVFAVVYSLIYHITAKTYYKIVH